CELFEASAEAIAGSRPATAGKTRALAMNVLRVWEPIESLMYGAVSYVMVTAEYAPGVKKT
ncbi:MAG TPA: hypothetical protein VIJ77_12460, partial [Candidatus Tumulicola sp.]